MFRRYQLWVVRGWLAIVALAAGLSLWHRAGTLLLAITLCFSPLIALICYSAWRVRFRPEWNDHQPAARPADPTAPDLDHRSAYHILGVPRSADFATIREAYQRLVEIHDPDAPGRDEVMREQAEKDVDRLTLAFELLGDPVRRRGYDAIESSDPPLLETAEDHVTRWANDRDDRIKKWISDRKIAGPSAGPNAGDPPW